MTPLQSIIVPTPPKKVVQAGRDWLTKNQKSFGLAASCTIDGNGDLINPVVSNVCHQHLSSRPTRKIYGVAIGSSWLRRRKDSEHELVGRFYDWLVNRSWASQFIFEDVEFARDYGVVLNADMPSNFLAGVATLMRTCTEHFHYVQRMFSYLDDIEGMTEDLAYLCAFTFTGATDKWGGINTNHNAIAPHDFDYFVNFLRRRVNKVNLPYSQSTDYHGVSAMWGNSAAFASDRIVSNLRKAIEAFDGKVEVKTEQVVIPNPFKPVVPVSYQAEAISEHELVKTILPALVRMTKGIEYVEGEVKHAAA